MGRFRDRFGPWALVTGASAGIGEEFARQLAAKGLSVALVARREGRLQALAGELQAEHGVDAVCIPLDLTEETALDAIDLAVGERDIGLVVDNAGFGTPGLFVDQEEERLREMIRLNCEAVALLATRWAKRLRARGGGGLVISASVAGYFATPTMAAYGATKAFDLSLAEAASEELRGTGVAFLALCPGYTETEFQVVATGRRPDGPSMKVEPVVAQALRRLGRRPTTVTGLLNAVAVQLPRLLPRRWMAWAVHRILRNR